SSESETRVKRNLLVFLRPTIMLDKGDTVAATNEKYEGLWEVNLGVREKLGLTGEANQPPIETLFKAGSTESRQ
ncbi:MAG: hypothetical protein KGY54_14985, partial [Oleiphilaceae bacterium]|nr:hypothetical protein [Oleiphilaceae bacterium]